MAARSIFVTWPMEVEARAVLERAGTVRTEGHRPPNLVNPEAWRPA